MELQELLYQGNALLSWFGEKVGGSGAAFCLYLCKAAVFMGLFYLLYKVLLSRESFSRFNRVVLLSAFVLSCLLPLWVLREQIEVARPALRIVSSDLGGMVASAAPESPDWAVVLLWGVYGSGLLLFLLRRLLALAQLRRMLVHAWKRRNLPGGVVLAVSAKARMAFSMGRYIVLPENLAQSEDLPMVLRHEMAHIRLRHSWDLLMADLAGCLQWFNPFCHLLRRELQAVHEFEADREVLGKGVDAEAYSMLLIRVSSGREILPKQVWGGNMAVCSNALNYNQLKNRLKMMTRQESKRGAKAKALCFLPVLAVGLLLFGQKEYVYARVSPLPESGDVRTETITALQEAVSPARALASDTSLEEKIQQVQSISASIADDLFKISLEVSEEVEAGIREVLDALDSRMEFEINGKTVGLSELVKGVQDGLYDEKQLEITAFRIKDEDDSSRLEVSFDGQVMVWDENGGDTLTLTTISKPDSGVSLTTSSSSVSVVRGDGEDDVRIYVDGKEVSREDFKKMSPDQFASIVVNKGDGTKYLSVTTVGKPDSAVSMTASSSSVSVAYGDGEDDDVRVYVDGKEVSKADLKEMSPEEISAVTVAKPEEGGKAIYVVTKRQEQKAKAGNEPRYFIDGEEVASEAVNGLDPDWIKSMRVEKDDETGESLIHIALRPAGRKAMKAAKAGEGE
ncbi:MAG: hypothetical protein IAB08_00605 [Bacteroidetes bacterium]|uniref:Peptidase M56 domain-containing protein n=1 Tax=Candidatus Pullibacteroides excrementavium TaxID=2840905 RepID=A0A9D9H1V8_9BACT|nr:hypothetical protein [Candidatus Pullibacteroides excrementavium]